MNNKFSKEYANLNVRTKRKGFIIGFLGREKLKEKKIRMRELTIRWNNFIGIHFKFPPLWFLDYGQSSTNDHSRWFHIPCKATSKHPASTAIPGYFHLAFHRKGAPPALLVSSSSSCSRIGDENWPQLLCKGSNIKKI